MWSPQHSVPKYDHYYTNGVRLCIIIYNTPMDWVIL